MKARRVRTVCAVYGARLAGEEVDRARNHFVAAFIFLPRCASGQDGHIFKTQYSALWCPVESRHDQQSSIVRQPEIRHVESCLLCNRQAKKFVTRKSWIIQALRFHDHRLHRSKRAAQAFWVEHLRCRIPAHIDRLGVRRAVQTAMTATLPAVRPYFEAAVLQATYR